MDRRKILLLVAVVVAALGAGLVFVYAQGAEDRAREKIVTVPVLVAVAQIAPGESASDAANAGKLDTRNVPQEDVVEGSTIEGTDFKDTIALTTIYPGEQLLKQKFGTIEDIEGRPTLPIPEGQGAATFELSAENKVGSFAQPGSHVAVYVLPTELAEATTTEEEPAPQENEGVAAAPACLIEDDLLVLGVGSTSVGGQPVAPDGAEGEVGADNAQGEIVGTTLMTAAVTSDQAAILVGLDRREIELIFVLRNDESKLRPTRACQPVVDLIKASLTDFVLDTPTTTTTTTTTDG